MPWAEILDRAIDFVFYAVALGCISCAGVVIVMLIHVAWTETKSGWPQP